VRPAGKATVLDGESDPFWMRERSAPPASPACSGGWVGKSWAPSALRRQCPMPLSPTILLESRRRRTSATVAVCMLRLATALEELQVAVDQG